MSLSLVRAPRLAYQWMGSATIAICGWICHGLPCDFVASKWRGVCGGGTLHRYVASRAALRGNRFDWCLWPPVCVGLCIAGRRRTALHTQNGQPRQVTTFTHNITRPRAHQPQITHAIRHPHHNGVLVYGHAHAIQSHHAANPPQHGIVCVKRTIPVSR